MKNTLNNLLTIGLACGWFNPQAAEPGHCTATSQPNRTALVELYTSEGCSSCPPADRWLSEQVTEWDPKQVVALAFHVDYWDRLGWTDRFAQSAFSARQRDLASLRGTRTVYTPQLLVSGQSLLLNAWPSAFNRQVDEITSKPANADIQLELSQQEEKWQVAATGRVHPAAAMSKTGLFIALYQDRLSSRVKAGENEGKWLRHDRVVHSLLGPLTVNRDGGFSHHANIDLPDGFVAEDSAVVAFIQGAKDGAVLQALELQACAE
jgi:hypothetical protein